MNPYEATEVLKMVARFDRRTIAGDDIKLWAAVLSQHGVSLHQAIRAVEKHYTDRPDDWIKPGHIVGIVARERSTGLAHSARLEQQALASIDADDPDYTTKALGAIRMARRAAADSAAVPSLAKALPSGYAGDQAATSQERRRRIRAQITAEIEAHPPKVEGAEFLLHGEEDITPALRAARARAETERRTLRRRGDPTPISETLRHIPLPPRETP